jgi:fructokinase
VTDRARAQRPVLAMGEILIDFIVADGAASLAAAETFVARAGGAPANAAVALARLGVPSAFCGVTGDDPFGAKLRQELAAEDVDTTRLRATGDAATTLAYAWKDERGNGHFWLLRGADTSLSPADAEAAGIADLSALVVGSVALAAEPSRSAVERAIALAHAANVPVVFDVNLRPTLWGRLQDAAERIETVIGRSDLVKLSLDDARGLFGVAITPGEALERVLRLGPRAAVLTDGDQGCWLATAEHPAVQHVPAFPVDAVEPTGAGDAFTAAIVARMLESGLVSPTMNDVRYAAAAGALATTRRGAWEGLPTGAQLDAFLAPA